MYEVLERSSELNIMNKSYFLKIYVFYLTSYNAAYPQSLSATQGRTAKTSELETHDAAEFRQLNTTD